MGTLLAPTTKRNKGSAGKNQPNIDHKGMRQCDKKGVGEVARGTSAL